MRQDRKLEILEMARRLFNERGYEQVSMRCIADALEMSVGNLTYYYKKKEDLVEAVILEQHKLHEKFLPPVSLEEMDALFRRILRHQKRNIYYFRHYDLLAQQFPKIYQMQCAIVEELYAALEDSFVLLRERGLLEEDQFPRQGYHLVQALMMVIYGHVFQRHDRRECLWSLIYPLLTDQGRQIYNETIGQTLDEDTENTEK
ncbi:TetR/AcrR family transcriptional regulator [Zongyangia hominis]|uniref:TetR/AcrR family transcriptional regulator n=1 Tax=Zongyangia hominis TaxID=2763677 RepID=A0A926E7R2_9FIRM|nr:TetR/AcrR family transcriptional regulator [Zongyangia hominis]MBC8569405.1 TetR/AcrR family transcriptional regulator [Zongyangia hominis]